jgi:hypothetical protein
VLKTSAGPFSGKIAARNRPASKVFLPVLAVSQHHDLLSYIDNMAFPGMQGMGGVGDDAGMSNHEKKTVQMVHLK